MGIPSVKRHASLETYSKRGNKLKGTYERRTRPNLDVQGSTDLLTTAALPTPPCDHRQEDSPSADHSKSIQRGWHARQEPDPSLSSEKLFDLETPRDKAPRSTTSLSTTPKPANILEANSPLSNKKVSDTSSQDSTRSLHRGGSNPRVSKDSTALEDTTASEASKKRGHDSQALSQVELPPIKKPKQSITSYFKPLPRSSSPPATQSCHNSSDTFKSTPTPPSSPPSRVNSPIAYPRKSQKRRLTTKPCLPPIAMSSEIQYGKFEEDEDTVSFTEAVGDMTDESRVELAEQALDREEARDTILSTSFPSCRPSLAGIGITPAPNAGSRSNTATPNPQTACNDENNTPKVRCSTPIAGSVAFPEVRSKPIPIPQRKQSGLKQMYFDIHERDAWIQCKECDRYYDPTSQRGKARHDIEHNKRVHAKVTKKEMSTVILEEWIAEEKKHRVAVIDCKQPIAVRSHGQAILGITSEALGPVHVEKEELWREIPNPQSNSATPAQVPRFRIFVHYIDDEAVSVILAERIRDGCTYHPGRSIRDDGAPMLGEPGALKESLLDLQLHVKYPVWVSIERIWVRDGHRRKGYATKMVDLVRENFVLGLPLDKDQIAFSCPFGSGVAFATKYCHRVFGDAPFLVNADEVRH